MLNSKILSQLIIAYKLSPFIKRAVIIKITVAAILYGYWTLGKAEVFRQLNMAVVEMKALDTRNTKLMSRIKDVGMVNQAIQKMEFNVVDSGKVFGDGKLDAELLTLVSYHSNRANLNLLGLSARNTAGQEAASTATPKLVTEALSGAVQGGAVAAHDSGGAFAAKSLADSKGSISKKKAAKEQSSQIRYQRYQTEVEGTFADIMAFVDSLVRDKRYVRIDSLTIASHQDSPHDQAIETRQAAQNELPVARVAFGVYVLNSRGKPL